MKILLAAAALLALGSMQAQASPPKAQIMIVGVAHLVSKRDIHNSAWRESALSPGMQEQIEAVIGHIATFRPTKVMIEAPDDPIYAQRYLAYLAGTYQLGPNEDDQYGYRLAALAHNATIYPVDTSGGFPFDYGGLLASARKNGQTPILKAAESYQQPLLAKSGALESQGRLRDDLRYLNTPQALDSNAAWYMFAARIGARQGYAGANLVSFWWARNLHIFANIMHAVEPGDRVVVFIGQGHAALLRQFVQLSPDLQLVDPEPYL